MMVPRVCRRFGHGAVRWEPVLFGIHFVYALRPVFVSPLNPVPIPLVSLLKGWGDVEEEGMLLILLCLPVLRGR